MLFVVFTFFVNLINSFASSTSIPDLHPDHFKYFLRNNPEHYGTCMSHDDCKNEIPTEPVSSCWGYEKDCVPGNRYKKTGEFLYSI